MAHKGYSTNSESNSLVTFPNFLTAARVAATPWLVWMYFAGYTPIVVAVCYFAVALTDFFDGRLARRWHQESASGEWLDPLTDKIFTIPFLGLFWYQGEVISAVFWLLVTRELVVTVGRWLMGFRCQRAPARMLGKIKVTFEYIGVGCFLLGFVLLGNYVLIVALAFAYASLIQYMAVWGFIPKPIKDFCFWHIYLPFLIRVVRYLG